MVGRLCLQATPGSGTAADRLLKGRENMCSSCTPICACRASNLRIYGISKHIDHRSHDAGRRCRSAQASSSDSLQVAVE
jgi:hypothetical protein